MPETALGVDQRVLERAATRWCGDLDPHPRGIGPVGTCEVEGTIEAGHDMAGGAGVRLGQQHPEAGSPNPNRPVRLAGLRPDQIGQASCDPIERLAAGAAVELEQQHRRRAPIAGVARRFVDQGCGPVRPRIELVGASGPVAIVDRRLAPPGSAGRAVQKCLDPRGGSLIVMVVREDEARRPARRPTGGLRAI